MLIDGLSPMAATMTFSARIMPTPKRITRKMPSFCLAFAMFIAMRMAPKTGLKKNVKALITLLEYNW